MGGRGRRSRLSGCWKSGWGRCRWSRSSGAGCGSRRSLMSCARSGRWSGSRMHHVPARRAGSRQVPHREHSVGGGTSSRSSGSATAPSRDAPAARRACGPCAVPFPRTGGPSAQPCVAHAPRSGPSTAAFPRSCSPTPAPLQFRDPQLQPPVPLQLSAQHRVLGFLGPRSRPAAGRPAHADPRCRQAHQAHRTQTPSMLTRCQRFKHPGPRAVSRAQPECRDSLGMSFPRSLVVIWRA